MQYEPLQDLQVVEKYLLVAKNNQQNKEEVVIKVKKELEVNVNELRVILAEVSQAFNAVDQAKDIKKLAILTDSSLNNVHVLEDSSVLSPVQAGEALSALGRLIDFAVSIVDPELLKTSIN